MQSSSPTNTAGLADRAGEMWSRVAQKGALAVVAGGGILAQPNVPLHLPGHRALVWLALLLAVRLLNGAGWSSAIGVACTAGALLFGTAPHEVAAYAVAGVLIDVALLSRPAIGEGPLQLIALGAGVSLAVGWIAPFSQHHLDATMLGYFAAFGAAAGLLSWTFVALGLRRRPTDASVRLGMVGPAAAAR